MIGLVESGFGMAARAHFWLLAAFLCIVFFTGGSTWGSEPQLMLLRPAALLIAGCAIVTLRWEHIASHWVVAVLFLGAALLTVAHLVPLPFAWWSAFPGRDIIVSIDQSAGLGKISRPLSMAPDATLNALYALSIPFAVLLLAVQLNPQGHQRILVLLISLAALSGLFGVLQAGGSNIAFYPEQTPTSGLFANRNHQGALLALLIPMAAALSALSVSNRVGGAARAAAAPLITVIAIPLLLVTGSRSALLVAAVGLVFGLFIWSSAGGRQDHPRWLRLVPLAVVTAVVGGLVWLTALASRDVAIERLGATENELRWPVWQSIIEMLPHYMPWGTGIGSYAQAYQIMEPDSLLRPTISNHAHNEFLEVAFTAGIPGLVLLGIAFAALLFALWRSFSIKTSNDSAAIFSRLGGSVLVLLAIASASDYPTRTPIFAAVLALASVWASIGGRAISETKSKQGPK